MKLSEIAEKLQMDVKAGADNLDREVIQGYASDLMSDVMANAADGALWVTMQTHQNIVAVAVMKSLACIILVNNRQPEEETLNKAAAEGIPVLVSPMPAFELIGKLFELGISGN